jgi:aldehyde:ferredoxin oxidoreductase
VILDVQTVDDEACVKPVHRVSAHAESRDVAGIVVNNLRWCVFEAADEDLVHCARALMILHGVKTDEVTTYAEDEEDTGACFSIFWSVLRQRHTKHV